MSETYYKTINGKKYDKEMLDFADEAKYDIIFDKSSDLIMLFSDSELDKSDNILEKLGY